jgi:hypothetical protein
MLESFVVSSSFSASGLPAVLSSSSESETRISIGGWKGWLLRWSWGGLWGLAKAGSSPRFLR